MSPASFEESTLYATQNGSARWATPGTIRLTLADTRWVISPPDLRLFRNTVKSLVQAASKHEDDCRWQVRSSGNPTVTLSSNEVRQLASLVEGTMTMLELENILAEEDIDPPHDDTRGG